MSDRALGRARQLADFTIEDIGNVRKQLKTLKQMQKLSKELGAEEPELESAMETMDKAATEIEEAARKLRSRMGE